MVKGVEKLELSEKVLDTLEQLDAAVLRAREVFNDVFVRLVKHRFSVGERIELGRVSVLQGHTHGATHAKVTRHFVPDLALGRPENTRMWVQAVTLRKNGSETTNLIQFSEPVLGRAYETWGHFRGGPDSSACAAGEADQGHAGGGEGPGRRNRARAVAVGGEP